MTDDGRQCGKNYLEFPQLDLSKMGILACICAIIHFPLMPGTFYQQLWAHKASPEGFGSHHHPLVVAPHTPLLAGLGIH